MFRKRRVLCAAATSLLLASGAAASGDVARPGSTPEQLAESLDAPPVLTMAQRQASDIALQVEKHPAFGGIRVTPNGDAVEVYVTTLDAGLRTAALTAALGAPVRFTVVKRSWHELSRLITRMAADRAVLEAQGIHMIELAVGDSLNKVMVGVSELTEAKADVVRARYGTDLVHVFEVGRPQFFASRLDDSAPWNGGDFISGDGSGNDCSSGPAVKNSAGHRFLLTAGHCFRDSGSSSGYVYRVFQGTEGSTLDDPEVMGYAKAEMPPYGGSGYDVAVLDPTLGASGLVWGTDLPLDSTTRRAQKGTIRAVEGTPICLSGAFSGERCNATVETGGFDTTLYDPWTGQTWLHQNVVKRLDSAAMAGPGDSGGPAYQVRTDLGGVLISGHIVGAEAGDDGYTCPNNSFINRGVSCARRVYTHGIGSILSHLGLTLYTR